MLYMIINENDNIFGENITLGQAFQCIDNYCNDNNAKYELDDISHKFNNEIEIEVHLNDKVVKFNIKEQ